MVRRVGNHAAHSLSMFHSRLLAVPPLRHGQEGAPRLFPRGTAGLFCERGKNEAWTPHTGKWTVSHFSTTRY